MEVKCSAVSVIMPAFNESECIRRSVTELLGAMRATDHEFEVVVVDDGSTDSTPLILDALAGQEDELRIVRLTPNSGQSAAFGAGFEAARFEILVTIDADGQNDPADIPKLLEGLADADVCCGYRADRQDSWSRRTGSRLARCIRNATLKESIIDTGCSLKAFKAQYLRRLMMFDGMHRFLPTLCMMQGARVSQVVVNHRARMDGTSKYTNLGRLAKTIWDLIAVRWMKKRYRRHSSAEI